MNEDQKSEIEAIQLLDNYLSEVGQFPEESGIKKEQLLKMYIESRDIVRQNSSDIELSRTANSLWGTCIRIVRCSGIAGEQAKELLIQSKTYAPEAKSLYEHALKLYVELQAVQKY